MRAARVTVHPPRKEWTHEGPFVTEHTTALVPDPIRGDELGVGAEQAAVLLVRGEAGKTEQGQGLVAGAFCRPSCPTDDTVDARYGKVSAFHSRREFRMGPRVLGRTLGSRCT
jgi:hypothetical protein